MNIIRSLILTVALPVLILPQEAPKPSRIQKIIEIKHADPQSLANVLSVFGVDMRIDAGMKIIAVNGLRESVVALEEAIKRLDVPTPAQKNIELTFHVLQATPGALPDKPPAELDEVTKRLRSLFSYQGFSLLDTLVVRVRDGRGSSANGLAPDRLSRVPNAKSRISLSFRGAHLSAAEKTSTVRLADLRFQLRVPVPYGKDKEGNPGVSITDAEVHTDIDVREGQKVVVGKTAMDGSDGAVILIVTAKVVE